MLDQGYSVSLVGGMLRCCYDIGYSMLDQAYGICRGDVATVL